MSRQHYPPYSAMFYYPDGSRKFRLSKLPGHLEGIMKRCRAKSVELFKGEYMFERIDRTSDGSLVSSYPNQLTLF